jgi:hypothetical protein
MSDPIADILRLWREDIPYGCNSEDEIAKQIRQQVGREIWDMWKEGEHGFITCVDKVCKLEDE